MVLLAKGATHPLLGHYQEGPLPCGVEGSTKTKGENPNKKPACLEA
jgi:hypothetical protein